MGTAMQRAEESGYVRWFKDIRLDEVASVGGKNASLGELYSTLSSQGIKVPNGFVLTAQAYRDALTEANAWQKLHHLLARPADFFIAQLAEGIGTIAAAFYPVLPTIFSVPA